MTNQVSPYYFKDNKNNIYNHLNYVSGVCALTGESLANNHHLGKYYLTTNKKELAFYQEKSNILLKKASPLMDIYREESNIAYKSFLSSSTNINTERVRTYSSLPLFTISESLLRKILKRIIAIMLAEAVLHKMEIRVINFHPNRRPASKPQPSRSSNTSLPTRMPTPTSWKPSTKLR